MRLPLSRSAAAACAAIALLGAAQAQAATVTVRVEGQTRTLLPETRVTVPDGGAIGGDVATDCEWNEPAGALHVATGGDWNRGAFVDTILGERHVGATGWFVWVNGTYGAGACFQTIADGDEILFTAGPYDANFNPAELPLTVRDVPARVERGKPFTVTVTEIQPDFAPGQPWYEPGTGRPVPAVGATVVAGSATATTGADGRATLVVDDVGEITVRAHRNDAGSRSKPVPTCATNGSDGACGSAVPGPTQASPPPPDRTPPRTLVSGIADGRVFRAGRAPRLLRGRVEEPGGVLMVKMRLTRRTGDRCFAYSARRERFIRRPRCGAGQGWWFRVGTSASWEYQLPGRLTKGRYVLDVKAIDRSYNRDEQRRRGENRIVFHVR
jgi:hypothetical protein